MMKPLIDNDDRMQFNPARRWFSMLGCCLLGLAGSCSSQAADARPAAPATVAEAANVLDLATFPLMDGAEAPQRRVMAGLLYNTPGTVKNVFEFQRKHLADMKWQELPGEYVSDESANGMFSRNGFSLSVSVSSSGQAGTVQVNIINLGNVRLDKLPVPPDAKPFFSGPAVALFTTESPVEKAAEACRQLLLEKGWAPYGKAGDSQFFKQNAVRLTAFIASAPAQGGKTMIHYSTTLMSVDLPAPSDAIDLRYADATTTVSFDTNATIDDVVRFYRTTLARAAWNATTDQPFHSDFKKIMIFRNPQKDLLTLEMTEVDGKNRVFVKHQSAEEIAELDRLIKPKAEAKKAKEAEAKNGTSPE